MQFQLVNISTDTLLHKNAFQWDVYRPLVDRIPVCNGWGMSAWGMSASGPRGGVYPSMQWGRHSPCGQTDTCENITFANFVCGQ